VPLAIGGALASAFVPGLGQALQRRWRAAALFAVPTVAAVVGLVWILGHDRTTLLNWSVDADVLRAAGLCGVLWALWCAVSVADAVQAVWPPGKPGASGRATRAAGAVTLVVATLAATLPGLAGAWIALRQDRVLETVFASSEDAVVAVPSPLADLGITTTAAPTTAASTTAGTGTSTTVTPTTIATTTTAPLPPPGRWNIALLGGDAGPYRWGERTDTMIVVSIDRQTGDLASVSVPRNLRRLPVPPVLRDRFPNGFDDLANALYTYVMVRPELGLDPAAVVKGALAELLGIPIDHYVLVDMQGFIDVIDALGGVTVNLSSRVELIPNMDRKTEVAPYVGPGVVTMDGTMALSFVRTREQDSDYGRMSRQRCLLAAVARSTSPTELALSYVSLLTAIETSFRSDIPRERLGELVNLFAKVNVDQARTLVLVPPVIQPGKPDIAKVRGLVAALVDAAAPVRDPSVTAPTC
jgi:LCP family protein required for cell wall assembly